jgi:hypothetical protein
MDELMVRGCGGVSVCGIVTSRRRRGATTFTRDSGGVCDRALARSRDGGGWITIVVVVVVWSSCAWSSCAWSFVCARDASLGVVS